MLVMLLGLTNLGRLAMAVHYAQRLPDLPMTVSWTYLALMGAVWCVVFLVCTGGLVYFRSWGRWAALVSIPLYQVHVWVNHLSFDVSERAGQLRPRDEVCTAILLAIVWGLLCVPSIRRVFNPPEDPLGA
jgi:uncharacterized membrane protein (DUF2068 family)